MRLDDYLLDQGTFESKDDVLRAVVAGEVLIDEVLATSVAEKVADGANVRVRAHKQYVSRGGLKLKGAIDTFGIDVRGLKCLDIGSSTGGFTDCLLQEGAARVACVDVNYGQLDWKIRSDNRVSVFERTNIKKVTCKDLKGPFEVIVIDVSFIGLSTLASCIAGFCSPGSILLALVKPQFESKVGETKGGVVTDEAIRLRCVAEVEDSLKETGFAVEGFVESPIKGRAGNVEYLIYAIYDMEAGHINI